MVRLLGSPEIGKPVREEEIPVEVEYEEYAEVWPVIDALQPGEWLPVTFESPAQALHFTVVASRKYRTKQMRRVVYVSLR